MASCPPPQTFLQTRHTHKVSYPPLFFPSQNSADSHALDDTSRNCHQMWQPFTIRNTSISRHQTPPSHPTILSVFEAQLPGTFRANEDGDKQDQHASIIVVGSVCCLFGSILCLVGSVYCLAGCVYCLTVVSAVRGGG
jgi:hypothetical protein